MSKAGIAQRCAVASATTMLSLSLGLAAAPAQAKSVAVNVADYDALTDEQLGVSNYVVHIATQPTGEWYGMGITSYQGGDEGYRWQIGFWLQPLGITQYRLPAYRELYRESFEGFVAKMAHRDTWSFWLDTSVGNKLRGTYGALGRTTPTADPIIHDNINYSANLLGLMTMHEMFYRNGKYLAPASFVLKRWTQEGVEAFVYDMPKVAHAIAAGFKETGGRGVACEVSGIYPAYCNQLAMLALTQYDQVVPGKLGADTIAHHRAVWSETSDLYRMDAHAGHGEHARKDLFLPQAYYVHNGEQVDWGNTLMMSVPYLNAWYPKYVDQNYDFWKGTFPVDANGTMRFVPTGAEVRDSKGARVARNRDEDERAALAKLPEAQRPGHAETGETPNFVYYSSLGAAERGDQAFLSAIRNSAAKNGNVPTWHGIEFFYDHNDEAGDARMSRGGSSLMTASYLVVKDGYRTLYNQPWSQDVLNSPQIEEIAWPGVLVRRATYDKAKGALVFTLLNSGSLNKQRGPAVDTEFAVAQLDPAKSYLVTRDGKALGRVSGDKISDNSGELSWRDSRLMIKATLNGDSSYIVQAQ